MPAPGPRTFEQLPPGARHRLRRFASAFEHVDAGAYSLFATDADGEATRRAVAVAEAAIDTAQRKTAIKAVVAAFMDWAAQSYSNRLTATDTFLLFQSLPDQAEIASGSSPRSSGRSWPSRSGTSSGRQIARSCSDRGRAWPTPVTIDVRPATAERWAVVVTLLGPDGDRGCWCQAWRGTDAAFGRGKAGTNRAALQAQVTTGPFAPGLVAYLDGKAAGWCGLGPRAAMPRLVRSRTIPAVDDMPVWSIGCFKVRVGYRRKGVARALLDGAIAYAREMGAPALEAYPIDPEGRRIDVSFGYVGFTPMFEAAGFRRVVLTEARSAGRPRWLMRLDLR